MEKKLKLPKLKRSKKCLNLFALQDKESPKNNNKEKKESYIKKKRELANFISLEIKKEMFKMEFKRKSFKLKLKKGKEKCTILKK